jgi:5-methylcytosine-specific restriction endonuclease McrA
MFDTGFVMSTLRSGLDELTSQELRFLSDGELDGRLGEARRAIAVLQGECARIVAEVERRGSFAADGHLSVTSWVESRYGVWWSEAAREVRVARGLEHMPGVRAALADGEVSSAGVAMLVDAREANPEEFANSEDMLVEAARTLPARGLKRAVEHWKAVVEPERALTQERERFERRGLQASPTFEGMVRVDGNLDPETGGTVLAALRAVTDGWARAGDDGRSPAQRRADALGEVCRGWLSRADRPSTGGERPHLTVIVDLETLEGRAGRPVATSEGVPLGPEAVRRLACDASVSRVITGARSEPLEAGRTTRVIPPALRRAVVVRDRGCAFPGCGRPASWCDAHHVVHWADGGRTDLGNLVLLCRRHHRLVHDRFPVELVDGHPLFRRPDRTVLADRAPP